MEVGFLAQQVSNLCLGKPALSSLPVSATVGEALLALKRTEELFLSVWSCDHNKSKIDLEECLCVGKVCMVDVISFLCKEENLKNPATALLEPVSVLIPKVPGLVRHLEPHASLLEAIDLMLEGIHNIVIARKKLLNKSPTIHNNREFCWLAQEDIIRYLLNSIGLFSPIPNKTIESLNIIETKSLLAVQFDDPASSVLPLISESLIKLTSVAIVDKDGRLIGDISPFKLNTCDETLATAIATLSAGDLMTYIDHGYPPEDLIQLVKERLRERKIHTALELFDEGPLKSSCSSYSSSWAEEFGLGRSSRLGVHSTRVVRSTDVIACHPWSSLVAVMIQAISHRVSYVWVVEDDDTLVGVVPSAGMLKVFRNLNSMLCSN